MGRWDYRKRLEDVEKTYQERHEKFIAEGCIDLSPDANGIEGFVGKENRSLIIDWLKENYQAELLNTNSFQKLFATFTQELDLPLNNLISILCKAEVPFLKYLEHIPDKCFSDLSILTSITIPENILYIGTEAFKNCERLHTIHIPKSVQSIEVAAFDGCNNLKSISYNGTMDEWDKIKIKKLNTKLTNGKITFK